MPKDGWLNDPNGLCYYEGRYHVFFQYAPKDPYGKSKYWGHYTSVNMTEWHYEGVAIKSDTEWDKDGAYSGSAYTGDGIMELFYTGNVKEDGEYDYIHSGRKANVITVKSEDGLNFTKKELLLNNSDYPANYTCHIRDPKVYREDGEYVMLLGGRRDDDHGTVLRYVSDDKKKWNFKDEITTDEAFGYMWECPDTFTIDGKKYLMCCPQGVANEKYRYQNIYQSGYFPWNEDGVKSEEFVEWDMGFEFYAPQTFIKDDRIIMYGWAGMPDIEPEYDNRPTIEEGWQHALTVPRELSARDGIIYQNPVKEIEALRGEVLCDINAGENKNDIDSDIDDDADNCLYRNNGNKAHTFNGIYNSGSIDMVIEFDNASKEKKVVIGDESGQDNLEFVHDDGIFMIKYLNDSGRGRKIRYIKIDELNNIRILKDTSLIEIFINDGLYAATMRYYPVEPKASSVKVTGFERIKAWNMKTMEVTGFDGKE